MKSLLPTAVIASVIASAVSASAKDGTHRVPTIRFEKYKLDNGLEVILHEDHSTPIVCTDVWYHVGSKNEHRGRTGFAHLFEHMMFQGSQHHDEDYFRPLQEAGGRLNGSTNPDRTNYWEVVPSNYLELALWLESDRMGFLLPAMTQQKLDNQRDVVKNERRQSYENRPYGLVPETIAAALYPPEHPYSWPTIGSMDDLTAASRDDIAQFFRRYYHPGNASLCIAGDIDPAATKLLVEKYFGSLPAAAAVERPRPAAPELPGPKRLRMQDRVSLPRVYYAWHTVPGFAPDDAELDLLASVLAGGKASRLYRVLVHEKQLAQDVSAYQESSEIAGSFRLQATARPGKELSVIEEVIDQEIARIQAEPPSDAELERALNRYEVGFVTALESVGGFGGRADRLNQYNVLTGDPGYATQDFERYARVATEGIRRVARKYLTDKRVLLEVAPGTARTVEVVAGAAWPASAGTREAVGAAAAEPPRQAARSSATLDRSKVPQPGPSPRFQLPPFQRGKLANGLELLVIEHHELPTVSMNLVSRFGSAADPPEQLGLAHLFAAMLDEGTEKRSATQIADDLAALGASLSLGADWDTMTAKLFTLKRQLPRALEIYADVLTHPAFPEEELRRQQSLTRGRLVRLRDEPTALASLGVHASLWGHAHPYGRPELGSESSVGRITRDDLTALYRTRFRPNRATLIVVGDLTMSELVAALEPRLGGWEASHAPALSLPEPPAPRGTRITLVDKPGSAQSVIAVSQFGIERKSPDYFPLAIVNTLWGGQFTSRLNMNLREEKGYTYGARSGFEWRRQPGAFVARASVQTAVTAPALQEFLKELRDLVGDRPVADKELEFAKTYIERGYPAQFETSSDIAAKLEELVEYELPDDYFNTVVPKIRAVSLEDTRRVAQEYFHPDQLSIIVVGDRAEIESSLRELPEGKELVIGRFDDQFRLVEEH